ncbi:MAG: hypothetical protein AAF611_15725 [Bacteroidota bacterium]
MNSGKNEITDWWKEVSEKEKQSIKLGLADANQGKLTPNTHAKKIYGKWL